MSTLVLVVLGALVLYALACWWWPYTSCGKCRGMGRFRSPSGRSWRPCGRCGGNGQRLRFGRWLWDVFGG